MVIKGVLSRCHVCLAAGKNVLNVKEFIICGLEGTELMLCLVDGSSFGRIQLNFSFFGLCLMKLLNMKILNSQLKGGFCFLSSRTM